MAELTNHYVYSQEVIDFVTVAVQTCLLLEHVEEQEKQDFAERLLQMLPMLYVKTRSLEIPEPELDGYPQHFVTEEDYNYVSESVKQMLGSDDVYLEVFVEDMRYSQEPISAFISENLADIYQELKDMAGNYQTEDEQVMSDGVLACIEGFHEHWGQKLLNTLRALHSLTESEEWKERANEN
ncbi:MAG: DUF5063 domain-containing protein [Paludibacteraceae bacterium]|nr:DUF5063 domain-containing protein [Paludibacteraceae bacterium]